MLRKLIWIVGLSLLAVHTSALSQTHGKTYTVGFVQDNMGNDWRRNQVMELQKALSKYPDVKFIYADAKGSAARQVLETENMIDSGVDILVASPQDANLMTPVLKRAYKKGVRVVLLTRKSNDSNYSVFISPDDLDIAIRSADLMAERLHGKGRIIMIKGLPTASTVKLRTRGFVSSLKKYPGLKIVSTIEGNYLRQDTIREMEKLLAREVKFDAIYAQSDSMAAGARLAMKKYGIDPKDKIIIGIDYIAEAHDAIMNGEQTASFTYPSCSPQAAVAIRKLIDGKQIKKRVKVPSVLITRKNADKIKPIF